MGSYGAVSPRSPQLLLYGGIKPAVCESMMRSDSMEKDPQNLHCVLQGVSTDHCPTTCCSSDFQETLYLLAASGMRESIKEGMTQHAPNSSTGELGSDICQSRQACAASR